MLNGDLVLHAYFKSSPIELIFLVCQKGRMLNRKRMPFTVVIYNGEPPLEIAYIKHNYPDYLWTAETTRAGATGKNRSQSRIKPAARP